MMTTAAEEKAALARTLDFAKGYSQYYNWRLECADGRQAESIAEFRKRGSAQPDAGVLCLELLKHSADIQVDPAAKAARPDQDLLAPYRQIAQSINQDPTDANAIKILNMYVNLANTPGIKNLKAHNQEVPLTKDGKSIGVATFRLRPESAFDANFVATMLNAYAGKPLPQSTLTSLPQPSLDSNTNGVYNNGLNIGESSAMGQAQAILKFQKQQQKQR